MPAQSPLVDTHCHLDLYADPQAVIRRASARRIYTVGVTNTPSVYQALVALVGSAERIRVALGLHPELAVERRGELPLFQELLGQTRYVGEVGLDYTRSDPAARRVQREILGKIVGWCEEAGGKVVTVHSRRAVDDVIDAFGVFRGTYVLHWYSGSKRALQRAVANGAYVSVNPAMAEETRRMGLIRDVPRERVLTESDGPFVQVSGRPAEPHDTAIAIQALGACWGVSAEEAQEIVHENFACLLRGRGKAEESQA